MAEKLEEVCKLSTDLKRCLNDSEVKYKLTVEDLAKVQQELGAVEAKSEGLQEEVSKLRADLEKSQKAVAALETAQAEHVAEKEAVEEASKEAKAALKAAKQ